MSKKPIQSRNWCFTDFSMLNIEEIYKNYNDIIRYICFGKEICPTSKKLHYQGWVQFYNKKRFGGVKRIFNNKIHLESCRGSEYDNNKYCMKDNNYKYFGTFKSQGQRSDLEAIKHNIDCGENIGTIMNDNFNTYCRYRKGILDYYELTTKNLTKKFRNVKVIIHSGATNTGKTRSAMKYNNSYKINGSELKWFDGYNQEKTLIIDEYDNDVKITKLLNILDGYHLRLPIKGGFTYANWNTVIITTNLNKNEFHINAKKKHRDALFRRINLWKNFNKEDYKLQLLDDYLEKQFYKVCRSGQGNTMT